MDAPHRTAVRRLGVLAVVALVASLLAATSGTASAASPKTPGRFTGYAFDTCVAPSNAVMDVWRLTSPFSAVGIYTSGRARACPESAQPNLSPGWVRRQAALGWRFLPIHVGLQAPCFSGKKSRMASSTRTARNQARAEADEAVAAARRYGFGAKNVLYLDIEYYNRANRACDNTTVEFIDAWNERVAKRGYRAGLYSSASAAIMAVDEARRTKRKGFDQPYHLWFAWENNRADVNGGQYLAAAGWRGRRLHQYDLDRRVSYGGKAINIDRNFLVTGGGSRATRDTKACGVPLTQPRYRSLKQGDRNKQVKLLRCLLRRQGLVKSVSGTYSAATARAVNTYRRSKGWSANGRVSRPVWTALLAEGSTGGVLKRGSTGEKVWRLQRSLKAGGASVTVNGVFDARTAAAVQRLRQRNGLPGYQTVDAVVWRKLQAGRRV
jgi:peptidoglycan hydrolase-like protein with peptidoglycan-binding domain